MEFKTIVYVNMKANSPLNSHFMVYNITTIDGSPCSVSVTEGLYVI